MSSNMMRASPGSIGDALHCLVRNTSDKLEATSEKWVGEEMMEAPVTIVLMPRKTNGENEAQILNSASPVETPQRAEWRKLVGLAGYLPKEWVTKPQTRVELPRYCQPGTFRTELLVRRGPAQAPHGWGEGFTAVVRMDAPFQNQTHATTPQNKTPKGALGQSCGWYKSAALQ